MSACGACSADFARRGRSRPDPQSAAQRADRRAAGGSRLNPAWRAIPAAFLVVLAQGSLGADAPPAPPLSAVPVISLVQVVLALLLVLAAVALFAWFLRRVSPGHAGVAGLRVVGGLMIGPRERLVIVEVADTWLLLGVASNNVSLVHTMPRPADAAGATPPDARFARLLGQVLKKRTRAG